MIEKTRKILTSVLGVIIIIGILYGVISLIISIFQEPDILSKDELQLHMIDSKLLSEYTTFYHIESCLDNLVEGVKRGKLHELYGLYMKDYKKQYTKDEVYAELKEFGVNGAEYKLKAVYVADNVYIVVYDLNGETKTMLMNFDSKETSYMFAIVK